jgi:hypothetical protein
MNNTIIVLLGITLIVLILLNSITIVRTTNLPQQSNCSQTKFGCCPDGVNSRIDYYGTNCPGYRPGPGYPLYSPPPPK